MVLTTGCSTPPAPIPTATATSIPTLTAVPTLTLTPLPSLTPTRPAQTGEDKATFISETFPDYSILAPGEKFIKTWNIKNTGATTWNTSYTLVLDSTPQKEALGSPREIPFPQEVPPGAALSLSVPLTAPSAPGTYAVYWRLKNDREGAFGVDGDRVWALILVCESGKSCTPPVTGGATSRNGVSATLTSFKTGAQSSTVRFCMNLPNRNYGPASAASISILVDQQSILATTGGSLEVGCFEFEFPVSETQIAQAQNVVVSIGQVRILGGGNDPQGSCASARTGLMAQYPGLDFQCSFSSGGYYTGLQLPAGMTATQADVLIVDAIEGAIYGPWVLKVKG